MIPIQIKKPPNQPIYFFLIFLFFANMVSAQFQIVGMQNHNGSAWVTSQTSHLTIIEPGKESFTGNLSFDAFRQFKSGTSFTTHANSSISIMYKGQMQVLHPNSTLKVIIEKNGIKAQTLAGTVNHILKDVKQKVGFYKAGNGYTWAHAEGTEFTVQAVPKSKKVYIATSEGSVVVTDEVPVSIGQQASSQGGGRNGRQLSTIVRTTNNTGEHYATGQNNQNITFSTYQEAIVAFEQETYTREQNGTAYLEELADSYTLIGELYLDIGEYDRALEPLGKAVQYASIVDSEDLYIIDTSLYYCEALMYSSDASLRDTGNQLTVDIINILNEELNNYLAEYNYANDMGDHDWAWDLCYDLVDINEYLGWSYDLIDERVKSDEFYNWADTYDSRL